MTDKQELFIREYLIDFNSTKAAIRAGYSARTAYSIGNELLKKPEISQGINQAMNERKSNLIADRTARQKFWTAIMYDENEDTKHRLRASELLAKSEGDFTDKHEIKADIGCTTLADFIISEWQEGN